MDRIWAPWRLAYVTHPGQSESTPEEQFPLGPEADPGCFLCLAAADPQPRKRWVIDRDELTVTVLNRFPYNNGHLLVAPRRHRGRLQQLTAEEQTALTEQLVRMVDLLERTLRPHGFNVGLNLGQAAGAGVPDHLHWHVVPRWSGDTNFMPTVASVKVIPQSLESLWETLVGELGGQSPSEDSV